MAQQQAHLKTGGEQIEFLNKVDNTSEASEECAKVFEALKLKRKHRYIVFKIGGSQIEVESVGDRSATVDDFIKALPFTDSRYAVYDHEFTTADGRPTSKLWFLSWFPVNSTPYNKMAYTSAKSKFRERLPGVFDIQAATAGEAVAAITGQANKDDEEDDDDDEDF